VRENVRYEFVVGQAALGEVYCGDLVRCSLHFDDLFGAGIRRFFYNMQYLHDAILRLR
jgi:hypothetical protein